MAYENRLGERPFDVVVATNDHVDRLPLKIALTTACERLDIPCWDPDTFVRWVRDTITGT